MDCDNRQTLCSSKKRAYINELPDNAMSVKTVHACRRWFTNEEIEQMAIGYKNGATVYELAEQFGCHRDTVSRHLKACGVQVGRQPITVKTEQQIKELYLSGLTCKAVGEQLGFCKSTVRKKLEDMGVERRDSHWRG